MAAFDALLHQALVVTALLCLPLLAVVTLIGTAVAIVQAATQVQDQTLSLLPKLVAAAICIALFGSFALHACAQLFAQAIAGAPGLAGG